MRIDRSRNCMGYALDIHAWLYPYRISERQRICKYPFDEHTLNLFVDYLIEHYALIRISREEALTAPKHLKVIAFRVAEDDFHFMVRKPSGRWWHKQGALQPRPVAKKVVFSQQAWESQPYEYDSETIFFVQY